MQIAKALGQPLHRSLLGVYDYPHTVNFAIRKRLQYDSFLELPKEKQPPDDIWDDADELEEWFDKVFNTDNKKSQTEAYITINDVEE